MKIGFIGLGHMGTAMAANLVKAGHDVSVFNRSPEKARALIELGAREATRLAEACDGEAVITMLANDDAACDITPRAQKASSPTCAKSAIHVSMSTISVALSKRLADAHAKAGQRYVAAPVFGRPDMAAAAKLFIVAAGDPATVDGLQTAVRCTGTKDIEAIGMEPSAANLVKLTANFLQASVIEALGEAIALIGKAGIDRIAYVNLLVSTIFTSPAYTIFGPLIAAGTFWARGFFCQHRSDLKISVWRWLKPKRCACRCRLPACCTIDFCGSLLRAAKSWIGLPSAAWRARMPAPIQATTSLMSAAVLSRSRFR